MFQGFNSLIQTCWDAGINQKIYNSAIYLAFAVQFVFLLFYRKRYGISVKKTVISLAIIYPVLFFWMLFITWVEKGFSGWGSRNIVRLYVWAPLLIYPLSKLVKLDAKILDDFLAPSMALQSALGHIVCPIAGCCRGYPCNWGIYNPVTGLNTFPNQWLESIVAFIIFLFLIRYARREGHKGSGKVFAMFLITFGFTRFLLEFLRDNQKVLWGISELAFHALFSCIVGLIWFAVVRSREKHDTETVDAVTT